MRSLEGGLTSGLTPHLHPHYPSSVLIRPKMHWLSLAIGGWNLLMAVLYLTRRDVFDLQFMVPLNVFLGAFLIAAWATTYTTLSGGVLKNRRLLFWTKSLPVSEIESVEPHNKNGKWGYGVVIVVRSKSGERLTLQPSRPSPFLAMLKQQASAANFLV